MTQTILSRVEDDVTIELQEWQTRTPEPGNALFGQYLDVDPMVRKTVQYLNSSRILSINELRDGLAISSSSFVGKVALGKLHISVTPKIQGFRLLNLLRYGLQLRDLKIFPQSDYSSEQSSFQDLLIHQLYIEAIELLSRGLSRQYLRVEEEMSSPRGKLNLQRLARYGGVERSELPCTYHPRLEDCLLNQVLLEGLYLGSAITEDLSLRSRLRFLASSLQDRVSRIRLDYDSITRVHRELNRLTTAYRPAITLIELLVEARGVSFDNSRADASLPGFFFDMNRFFQRLLSRFLGENLRGYVVRDEYRLKGMMGYLPDHNPLRRRAPEPRPDYVITNGADIISILDAKYRDLWDKPLPTDMLYQLAIYALSQEKGRSAIILYPCVTEEAREARIELRDPLYGGSRGYVVLRPVNLIKLEELITDHAPANRKEREKFARSLAIPQ
jgi:5-methylcytosine-specific restriction enzyme subunit McrC